MYNKNIMTYICINMSLTNIEDVDNSDNIKRLKPYEDISDVL